MIIFVDSMYEYEGVDYSKHDDEKVFSSLTSQKESEMEIEKEAKNLRKRKVPAEPPEVTRAKKRQKQLEKKKKK